MLRNKKGVSLITLIITIIVVIILAVIVMRGTGGTIEQANYSSYMDDLGKVKEAVKTKAMEVKGEYLIDGRVVSMEEIYHYVATGGKTGEDFVGKANVPAYTIIDREKADIGIEIPTRNIESGTARNVQIQYIVTKEGEVFAWPPYEYEDKLYITENITLAGKLDKDIQIENENFTLDLDATLGIVLPTEETSGGGNSEGGSGNGGIDDGEQGETVAPTPATYTITFNSNGGAGEMASVTQEENTIYTLPSCTYIAPEGYEFSNWLVNGVSKPAGASIEVTSNISIKVEWKVVADIDVGDYVTYNSDKGDIACRVWEVKANGDIVIMPAFPQGRLILGADNSKTGASLVASAATSYLNAPTLVTNLCKEYTSTTLGIKAEDIESLTIEELIKKTGYIRTIFLKYAYYSSKTSVSGTTTAADGLAGYTKAAHKSSFSNSITTPRFYTYDYAKNTTTDEEGNIYAYPTSTDPVFVTETYFNHNPNSSKNKIYSEMLGGTYGWIASSQVSTNLSFSNFYVCSANSTYADGSILCDSSGYANRYGLGVRPLVTLSSTLKLDSSVSGMDGSSSNPWQFVK